MNKHNFYSQNGEDFILDEIFKHRIGGFFIEIGCIDGRRFSNTLTFEERVWKGLCVEAHADYIQLLEKNRPNSIVCHCGAGECDEDDVTFYTNPRGSLSTLDKSKEAEFSKRPAKYFSGFSDQTVNKRRLDTLLQEFNIKDIDILSIAVGGSEVEVLKGIDFDLYRPKVLVIESDEPHHESQLDEILIKMGYHKSVKVKNNVFYLADKTMEDIIKDEEYNITVIHTQHPLDTNGDTVKHLILNLKRNSIGGIRCEIRHNNENEKERPINQQTAEADKSLVFFDVGFHGDKYLLALVNSLLAQCDYFIETGANVGSTLAYVAKNFPGIRCLSCEPHKEAFVKAQANIGEYPNVTILNKTSQDFLKFIDKNWRHLFEKKILFWLDAHGRGYHWPLKEEIHYITSQFKYAYILIDDFRVPGRDCFGYAKYHNQSCTYEYIKDSIMYKKYGIYYPDYKEKTSKHHPLRGWGLIEEGSNNPAMDNNSVLKIRKIDYL